MAALAALDADGGDGLRERGRRHLRDAGGLRSHRSADAVAERLHGAPRGPCKAAVRVPVLVAGRINQPQEAEAGLAVGPGRRCGMTRALICDPELPAKAAAGRLDDIRACIGCNQACIGHFHAGYPISCIQFPRPGASASSRDGPPGHAGIRRDRERAGHRRRPGRAEGGGRRRGAWPRVTLVRGRRRGGRPGAARPAAARAGRVRRHRRQPAGEARRAGVGIVTGVRADRACVRERAPDAWSGDGRASRPAADRGGGRAA